MAKKKGGKKGGKKGDRKGGKAVATLPVAAASADVSAPTYDALCERPDIFKVFPFQKLSGLEEKYWTVLRPVLMKKEPGKVLDCLSAAGKAGADLGKLLNYKIGGDETVVMKCLRYVFVPGLNKKIVMELLNLVLNPISGAILFIPDKNHCYASQWYMRQFTVRTEGDESVLLGSYLEPDDLTTVDNLIKNNLAHWVQDPFEGTGLPTQHEQYMPELSLTGQLSIKNVQDGSQVNVVINVEGEHACLSFRRPDGGLLNKDPAHSEPHINDYGLCDQLTFLRDRVRIAGLVHESDPKLQVLAAESGEELELWIQLAVPDYASVLCEKYFPGQCLRCPVTREVGHVKLKVLPEGESVLDRFESFFGEFVSLKEKVEEAAQQDAAGEAALQAEDARLFSRTLAEVFNDESKAGCKP